MKTLMVILSSISLFVLTACDIMPSRTDTVPYAEPMKSPDCIARAVRRVPTVVFLNQGPEQIKGTCLTPRCSSAGAWTRYQIVGLPDRIRSGISVTQYTDGITEVENWTVPNQRPYKDSISKAMDAVNESIKATCGLTAKTSAIK